VCLSILLEMRNSLPPWSGRLTTPRAVLVCCIAAVLLAALPAVGEKSRIKNTPTTALAEQVLRGLLSTPLGKTMPLLPWEFFLIDDDHIGASSDGAGKIFVTTGMDRWYLGKVQGVWAAVLAHEMGHALILNPPYWSGFEAELEKAEQQATGGRDASRVTKPLLARSAKDGVFDVHNPKQREYAADYIAMMLMAEAGYHPEYALTLDRWFSGSFYDPTRLTALMATHPRWEEREERAQKDYELALAIFTSRWPDAAKSPGGIAPPVGKLGAVTVQQSPDDTELLINVPFSASKAEGAPMRVVAVIVAGRALAQSKDARFRAPDGSLELNESFPGAASISREVSFRLPVAAIATSQHKLRLFVFLTAGDEVLAVTFVPIDLHQRAP
jgi:hypothetical protein